MTRLRLLAFLLAGGACVPLACGSPPRAAAPQPQTVLTPEQTAMWSEAQNVFETRCVVCHGCYDAPCQLKLGTFEGIERGASGDKVYDSTRLIAAAPTRLGIDAQDAEGWRKKGFHPVLPEGAASDPRASLLVRMLDLKRMNPLPAAADLTKVFSLDLERKETCTTAEHFEAFAKDHPLCMEGEADFLMLLPPAQRKELTDYWYRGVSGAAKETVAKELEGFAGAPRIPYRTSDPRTELLGLIEARVGHVKSHAFDLKRVEDGTARSQLERLAQVRGRPASLLPEMSFVTITGADGARTQVTILRDSAHTNVAHLFHEGERRVPAEDELTVVHGFLGAYPSALFEVARKDLPAFVDAIASLEDETTYVAFRHRFGVLRSSDHFWTYSDQINADHGQRDGMNAGLFDYNRLEGL
jgi:hypothetical protein